MLTKRRSLPCSSQRRWRRPVRFLSRLARTSLNAAAASVCGERPAKGGGTRTTTAILLSLSMAAPRLPRSGAAAEMMRLSAEIGLQAEIPLGAVGQHHAHLLLRR